MKPTDTGKPESVAALPILEWWRGHWWAWYKRPLPDGTYEAYKFERVDEDIPSPVH